MSVQSTPSKVFLTANDVREKGAELRRLEVEIADRQQRMKALHEWLANVAKIIGEDELRELAGSWAPPVEVAKTISTRNGKPTWTTLIESIVAKHPIGLDYRTLRGEMSSSVRAEEFARSDKSFYGSVAKLVDAGRLVRQNGLLLTPEALANRKAKIDAGELVDQPSEDTGRSSPMGQAVIAFVADHPGGVVSKQVVQHILGIAQFRAVVEKNSTSVYNVLSRLVERRKLLKEGKTYYPASQSDEAPHA